ncbi:MAG TPA: hypothetical protein VKE53_02200 [Pseudolabrys sp.]|nr:hypothetical protein [Pseudolabrys sp.]
MQLVTSKSSVRNAKALDAVVPWQKRPQIAGVVETTLGHRDQFARQHTLPLCHEAVETFIVFERLEVRRHVNRLASCERTAIGLCSLLDPLDDEVENSITFGEGLRRRTSRA